MRDTSPDEAKPWLHSKPMDAAIGRVLHRIASATAMADIFE